MAFRNYSEEQKNKIFNVICNEIEHSSITITKICKQNDIAFRTVQRWSYDNEEWDKTLVEAMAQRAWRYAEEGIGIIDNAPTYFEDVQGNKRDSNASVNKAKYQAEFRLKLAETLAPDTFGNLRPLLKQIEKDMAEIKKKLEKDDKTSRQCRP